MFPERVLLLAVCDETLGRSAALAANFKADIDLVRIEYPKIAKRIRVLNAGTKVNKRKSKGKYGGGAHPAIVEGMLHNEGAKRVEPHITKHRVRQLRKRYLRKNTIAVLLNDPTELTQEDINNCLLVLAPRVDDPSETDTSFEKTLSNIFAETEYISHVIIQQLVESMINDDFKSFIEFFRPIILRKTSNI